MCICAIAWQLFDNTPLVILSNRDEFLNRPTTSLHHWQHLPIIAGKDEQAGGTWLGINPNNGRWAIILNYRQIIPNKPVFHTSRGQIIPDFLTSHLSPLAFARQLKLQNFDGFNLVLGDRKQAIMLNNRGYPISLLANGLYVLSNGQPDDAWFKTERLRGRVRQEILPLIAEKQDWQQASWQVLMDTIQAENTQLPNTGLSLPAEKALSSIFITKESLQKIFHQNYGTCRSSLVYLTNQQYQIIERSQQTQENSWIHITGNWQNN